MKVIGGKSAPILLPALRERKFLEERENLMSADRMDGAVRSSLSRRD